MSSESTLNAKDKISDAIMKKVLQLCQDFNQNKNNSFETFFEKIITFLHSYPLWEIGYDEVNNKIFELRELNFFFT